MKVFSLEEELFVKIVPSIRQNLVAVMKHSILQLTVEDNMEKKIRPYTAQHVTVCLANYYI